MNMRKTIISIIVLVIAACFPLFAVAGPVVLVESPKFVFEEVPEGVRVDHEFVVKNIGDADLEIKNVLPP